MFNVEYREQIRELLVEKARSDSRLPAAAAVGGSAGQGDRWSDLDLTFAVADGTPVEAVLSDWTQTLLADFEAMVLFDLPFLSTIYQVFLLPGTLQVDLSFTPAAEFGAPGRASSCCSVRRLSAHFRRRRQRYISSGSACAPRFVGIPVSNGGDYGRRNTGYTGYAIKYWYSPVTALAWRRVMGGDSTACLGRYSTNPRAPW
jgi:hypothetical protein